MSNTFPCHDHTLTLLLLGVCLETEVSFVNTADKEDSSHLHHQVMLTWIVSCTNFRGQIIGWSIGKFMCLQSMWKARWRVGLGPTINNNATKEGISKV